MRDPKYSTTDRNWVRPRVNDVGGMVYYEGFETYEGKVSFVRFVDYLFNQMYL